MMSAFNVNQINIFKMEHAIIALKIVYIRRVLINVNALKVILKVQENVLIM
jgi:hypothetical protein